MNSIDYVIENILSKDLQTPNSYTQRVNYTLRTLPEKKNNIMSKKIKFAFATVCCCLCLTVGVVFAKNYIKDFFNFNAGMDTAIENGYIEEPKTEYIEVNDTEAKIENFLMDDFNFSFTVSIKLPDNLDASKIARGRLVNLIITDEENRTIYCENKDTFEKFKQGKDLKYEFGEYGENFVDNGSNWYIKEKDSETNTLKLIYNLYTPNKYPKSKKLNFSFTNINLSEREIYENEETVLQGNWSIDVDVPEKFYNRECIVYTVESCSNKNMTITQAEVYDTCMKFKFDLAFKKIYEEGDTEEEINKKGAELFYEQQKIEEELKEKYMVRDFQAEAKAKELQEKWLKEHSEEIAKEGFCTTTGTPEIWGFTSEANYKAYHDAYKNIQLFDEDIYVENSDGKRFYPSEDGTGELLYNEDWVESKIKNYNRTFTLTKYDATDELTVHLNYNPDYSGNWEHITIKLKR